MTAQKYSQKYKVRMGALDEIQNFCNHEINFSIHGGVNDIMKIEFLQYTKNSKVYIGAGETYESAVS